MSLAEELLADLEDDDDAEVDEDEEDVDDVGGENVLDTIKEEDEEEEEDMDADGGGGGGGGEMDVKPKVKAEKSLVGDTRGKSIHSVAKLSGSKRFVDTVTELRDFVKKRVTTFICGPAEADPEYQLIVRANNLAADIDHEMATVHKFATDNYSKRFPELESLVPNPYDYIRTVKALGNRVQKAKSNEVLAEILKPATIMVVSVTASTTQGVDLAPDELDRVMEAVEMGLELVVAKDEILRYVESRMGVFAPNLTIILGAPTAAKLMGVAGGLTNLAKIPACNVQLLGSQKRGGASSGYSNVSNLPHTGYIFHSPVCQAAPSDLRFKVQKLVAAKATLAARADSLHSSPDGSIGDKFRAELEAKIDKLMEPPPVKTVKALPLPLEGQRKKRGGRRYRKMKERLGMTEIRKQANRLNFGEIEADAYQDDLGFSVGTLKKGGKGSSGIRAAQVNKATNARMSQTLQKRLAKQQQVTFGGTTTIKKTISGTASSVAFTPLQGLEIVNPGAAERKSADDNKYFSQTSGFQSIRPKTT